MQHIRLLAATVATALALLIVFRSRRSAGRVTPESKSIWSLAALGAAGVWVAVAVALVINHVPFPLHLDLMEGTLLQHVVRAAAGLPIYPAPTPDYVPLAYNPLFYVLGAPLVKLFGPSLVPLRLLGVCGWIVGGAVVYLAVLRHTQSRLWAFVALGVFAAAYRAMDSYLDSAHSDSWLLGAALLGTYIIDVSKTRLGTIIGVLVLVASFWFKQHGAVFAVAAVVHLTITRGIRFTWPHWVLATALGPGLFWLAGNAIFGSHFLYFTWTVPGSWSHPSSDGIMRVTGYVARFYPLLVVAAVVWALRHLLRSSANIWVTTLIGAGASALLGSLDPWGSDNVFIPLGGWLIVCGMIALNELLMRRESVGLGPARLLLALAVLASLAYDPRTVWLPRGAAAEYQDFLATTRALHAPVYAPTIAYIPGEPELAPHAHWVALDDIMRGHHATGKAIRQSVAIAKAMARPDEAEYVFSNAPLTTLTLPVRYLSDNYDLVEDFGSRFSELAGLPRRFDHRYPRYLYRLRPRQSAGGMLTQAGSSSPR